MHEHIYNEGLSYYENNFFSEWRGETAVGEVDPEYMYLEKALDRIVNHLDAQDTKFIFLLRNPIERAFSHYTMMFRRGIETLGFEQALEAEEQRIASGHMENLRFSYRKRGYYLSQIERFLEHAPRENMLFLFSDELKSEPEKCLKTVFMFLGVPADFAPSNIRNEYHQSTWPRSIKLLRLMHQQGWQKQLARALIPSSHFRQNVRRRLLDWNQTASPKATITECARDFLWAEYEKENKRLASFLNHNLSGWR